MADTIPSRLLAQAKKIPNRPAYFVKVDDEWKSTDWKTYADEIKQAGKALMAVGVDPGGCVSILGFNTPEWIILDVAAMCVGASAAGVYTTCSAEEVQYIVDHCEASVLLIEDEGQWKKVDAQRAHLPNLKHVVTMKGCPKIDDDLVMSWDEFMARADGASDEDFEARIEALEPGGLATLIYTSGTTGPPKGVMLSHENLAWTSEALSKLTGNSPEDTVLSYLPLSHIAEQMMSIHGPITTGASVYFAESIPKVPDNLKEVQPTLIFGVPRIWEKFYAGVSEKLAQATGIKKMLVNFTRRTAEETTRLANRGEEPGLLLSIRKSIADKLVLSKLKPALGLGKARMCVSGAAPISKEILEFFGTLDIIISEVYGQSEDSGPTTFNRAGKTRFGTVGAEIPGIDVKIAEDGEILVKGPNLFLGYFKDEKATNEALIDGWLHSGDLGALDSDGFLTITGRKKDIIITAGGKNIAPKNIEAALKNTRLINEAVVIGDRRKYLTALITLDEEAVGNIYGTNGKSVYENAEVREEIEKAVEEVNSTLAKVETIKKFKILERNFTVEDGELTPTLKVKRKIVNEHFADDIETMYE
jgi:long-chain acyl-CoA synthetase